MAGGTGLKFGSAGASPASGTGDAKSPATMTLAAHRFIGFGMFKTAPHGQLHIPSATAEERPYRTLTPVISHGTWESILRTCKDALGPIVSEESVAQRTHGQCLRSRLTRASRP